MTFSKMAKKTYSLILISVVCVFLVLTIGTIAIELKLYSIFFVSLLLLLASLIAFVVCIVKSLTNPKKWKKEFLENHPEAASVIFCGCYIIELDGLISSVIDLSKTHTGFRGLIPSEPPHFRGVLYTNVPYRAFLENDGLGLPFTFGARNRQPVHYIAEGEHKVIIRGTSWEDSYVNRDFSFSILRGRKYEVRYDEERQILDVKDITGNKEKYSSWI